MECLTSEADRSAFLRWWKEEVAGRQPAFAPAFKLMELDLLPPFHTCWNNIKERRDKAARAMSTAGSASMSQLWDALKDVGDSWEVKHSAFAALSTWYGEHFPKSMAFFPQVMTLQSWPSGQGDPPGPGDVEELAGQWTACFGRGTADPARKCLSALGLIGVGDLPVVYGVDPRDQLVTVMTYDTPSEQDLHRVSRMSYIF